MKLAVVVEKPFTVNAADADHLIKVQEETGKTLTVFQSKLPSFTIDLH